MATLMSTAVRTSEPRDASTVSAMAPRLRDQKYRIRMSVTSDCSETMSAAVSYRPLFRNNFGANAKQFIYKST
jgi:hypothetical protein